MAKTTDLVEVAVSALIPYERNAKKHPAEQIEKLKASIEEFGFLSPCLIDKENNLIAGHGRVQAAKELGLEKVPCIYVEGLTDAQRRAYILADNRLTELGGWDMDLVDEELDALAKEGINVTLTGFDWEAAAAIEPMSKLGDIFQLGDHRLMCGDSTSSEDMDALMDGEQANMVFTDPPYGVAVGDKNKTLRAAGYSAGIEENIIGDTLAPDELYDVLVRAFTNLKAHAANDCSYYVSSPPGSMQITLLEMMRDAGLEVRHTLVWVKSNAAFGLLGLDYKYRHEVIFYTWADSHKFRGGYDQTVIDDSGRLEGLSVAELKELIHALRRDGETSVIFCDKPQANKLHPTMKPIRLVSRFIYNSSEEGNIVADIFGGSGSTLIACEQMKRQCRMMELDPHYCDVIIDRWEEFTGRKAVKINGR